MADNTDIPPITEDSSPEIKDLLSTIGENPNAATCNAIVTALQGIKELKILLEDRDRLIRVLLKGLQTAKARISSLERGKELERVRIKLIKRGKIIKTLKENVELGHFGSSGLNYEIDSPITEELSSDDESE